MVENNVETTVRQAVETWTETTREAYQTLTGGAIAASERNAQFAQAMLEKSIAQLETQAEASRAVLQTLAQQSERQWQAVQAIAQESANAYREFFAAPASYYQKWLDAAQRAAQAAAR